MYAVALLQISAKSGPRPAAMYIFPHVCRWCVAGYVYEFNTSHAWGIFGYSVDICVFECMHFFVCDMIVCLFVCCCSSLPFESNLVLYPATSVRCTANSVN